MRSLRTVVLPMMAATVAVAAGHQPGRELTNHEQAVHVLNRLAFGPRPGEVERVKAVGVDRWIEQQLQPGRIRDAELQQHVAQSYPGTRTDRAQLLREFAAMQRTRAAARRDSIQPDITELRRRRGLIRDVVAEVQSARVARAVASERQLLEVMTDFWTNHFNVFIRKNPQMAFLLADYEEGIREHGLGRFRDLLGFVATSPAMLTYLDNVQSVADSGRPTLRADRSPRRGMRGAAMRRIEPEAVNRMRRQATARRRGLNENYARELLELHTLGVDGGYTQQDVIEVARALTGWSVRPAQLGGGFVFRPEVHDADAKLVLGHRLPAGRGIEDGEQVLDIAAAHPATARFIATKLARRFVSDSPSTALIEYAAGVFSRTNGDIRETVRAIVTSPEFFSRQAFRSKVKSPFELVVSTARALGAKPDPTPRTALAIGLLGQMPYGHQAPNGYPETGEAWMNTGAILNRINFGLAVGAGRLPNAPAQSWPVSPELTSGTREEQVRAVIESVLAGPVSPQTERILMTGEHPMVADGSAARARSGAIPDLSGLAEVVALVIASPEFQRR